MVKKSLSAMHEELCTEARDLMLKKSHDYAGPGSEDPFKNFTASVIFDVPPERGVLLRLMDKLQRVNTFINTGDLKNESVKDSIIDGINYLIIMYALLEEREHAQHSAS